jgi:hypothetical protein
MRDCVLGAAVALVTFNALIGSGVLWISLLTPGGCQ